MAMCYLQLATTMAGRVPAQRGREDTVAGKQRSEGFAG